MPVLQILLDDTGPAMPDPLCLLMRLSSLLIFLQFGAESQRFDYIQFDFLPFPNLSQLISIKRFVVTMTSYVWLQSPGLVL